MSNKTVVLAIFSNEAAADSAAESLKDSGVAKKDAIGVLVLDEKGKIRSTRLASAAWARAPVSAWPWRWVPGWARAVLLAVAWAPFTTRIGLGKVDRDRIGANWKEDSRRWRASPVSESSIVAGKLTDLGGTTEAHDVSDEVLDEARTAAATATS